ncbi:MAG: hypothetical protein Q8L51_02245 [Candidatus Amesbacteria bacterium]|nr:hypothetical protein [Candidatus Amesbacteria bacterium]
MSSLGEIINAIRESDHVEYPKTASSTRSKGFRAGQGGTTSLVEGYGVGFRTPRSSRGALKQTRDAEGKTIYIDQDGNPVEHL